MATSSRSMADRFGRISHEEAGTFEVGYTGPFSLAASIRFLEGFTPAGYESSPPNHLDLAFCAGPLWHPVAVRVTERAGKVIGSFVGDVSPEAVTSNVARILSLDVDAREFPDVGRRDDVVAGLQAKYPGLRPVCFWTPYEAACWAVIGHRIRMTQAAAVKAKMTQQLGHAMVLDGTTQRTRRDRRLLRRVDPAQGRRRPRLGATTRATTHQRDEVGVRPCSFG